MVRNTGPTNIFQRKLISQLGKCYRSNGAPVWKSASRLLAQPRRKRVEVNLGRINRLTAAKETILVPGKVLGAGNLEHPVKVAAFDFTDFARSKIRDSGGRCLSIGELLEQNPAGRNVRIVG